jgi:hypothetical protein
VTGVKVTIRGKLAAEEIAAVGAVVSEWGLLSSPPQTEEPRRSTAEFVTVFLTTPLSGFFAAIGKEAAGDTYGGLKRLVAQLRGALKRSEGVVVLEDAGSGPMIEIPPDLPDDAISRLREFDFKTLGQGTISWDPKSRSWHHLD